MVVTLEISAEVLALVARHQKAAEGLPAAASKGLSWAVASGAEELRLLLAQGSLGLTMRHPASGLAASIDGWMLDESIPLAALGVPSNSPADAYAAILNYGGRITPKHAGALAVPISAEAKMHSSPRDMPGLVMIKRRGRRPLLVRELSRRGDVSAMEIHWVLLSSVTIPAFGWFDKGVQQVTPVMIEAFASVMSEFVKGFSTGETKT